MINRSYSRTIEFSAGLATGLLVPLGLPPLNLWPLSALGLAILFARCQRFSLWPVLIISLGFTLSYAISGQLWLYYSQVLLTELSSVEKFKAGMMIIALPGGLLLLTLNLYPVIRQALHLGRFSIGSALLFSCLWVSFELLYASVDHSLPLLISGYALVGLPTDSLVPVMGVFANSLFLSLLSALLACLCHQLLKMHLQALRVLVPTLLLVLALPWLAGHKQWTRPHDKRPFNYAMVTRNDPALTDQMLHDIAQRKPRLAIVGGIDDNLPRGVLYQRIPELNLHASTAYLSLFSGEPPQCPHFFCSYGEGDGCILGQNLPETVLSKNLCSTATERPPFPLQPAARHPAVDAYRLLVLSPGEDIFPFSCASRVSGAEIIVAYDLLRPGHIIRDRLLLADRARALETGRPLLRYSNVGVSASIDHRGRIQSRYQPEQNLVFGTLTPMSGYTLYSQLGPITVIALIAFALTMFAYRRLFQTL